MKKFKKIILIFILIILFCPAVFSAEPEVGSPSALLMDITSQKILFEKNINEKRYPASITKVMTAIVILENCNLEDIATVSEDAVLSLPSRICKC